jgi:hypothetical protein
MKLSLSPFVDDKIQVPEFGEEDVGVTELDAIFLN